MSKYEPLWVWIAAQPGPTLTLTFEQVHQILGFDIDHAFLTFKKELTGYGWAVGKISLKQQTIALSRVDADASQPPPIET